MEKKRKYIDLNPEDREKAAVIYINKTIQQSFSNVPNENKIKVLSEWFSKELKRYELLEDYSRCQLILDILKMINR